MNKWDALRAMLHLFVVEVGTRTDFDMPYMLQAMERELKHRRAFPASCSKDWMLNFVQSYRLAKAVHKAYPDLSAMHREWVNICYYQGAA